MASKKLTSKEQFLQFASGLKRVEACDVCGAKVFVRVMSGSQRESYEAFVMSKQGKDGKIGDIKGLRSKLVSLTLCDAEGALLDISPDEVNEMDGLLVEELFSAAQRVNKLGDAGSGEAEKN